MRLCFESKEIDEERTIDEGGSTQISQKNHRELLLTVSSFVRYILRTMPTQKMMMLKLPPFLKAFHAKFFFPPEHSQNDDKHVQQGGNKYTTKKKRPRFCGPSSQYIVCEFDALNTVLRTCTHTNITKENMWDIVLHVQNKIYFQQEGSFSQLSYLYWITR